jgi:hypothetical protein
MGRTWKWSGMMLGALAIAAGCGVPKSATTGDDSEVSSAIQSGDRIWQQTAELIAKNGSANDYLGSVVALSGTTALLGAWNKTVGMNLAQGAAYVFSPDAGEWTTSHELRASDGAAGDRFGSAVAIFGNTAVVGAPERAVAGEPNQGVAYVFTLSNGDWAQTQVLEASDGTRNVYFGTAVAISGDHIVIGAPCQSPSGTDCEGAAYVFTLSAGVWEQTAELVAGDAMQLDRLGIAVAISGDTAVVGTPYKMVGSNQVGVAYVFSNSGTRWTQEAELLASDGAAGDNFGLDVAVSGANVLVGAGDKTVGSNEYQGVAYVFSSTGGQWSEVQRLQGSDGMANDLFGSAVAISEERALIGAFGRDRGQGTAYVFEADGGTWVQTQELPSAGQTSSAFGAAVGLSSEAGLIGADCTNVGKNICQGVGYIEELRPVVGDGGAPDAG